MRSPTPFALLCAAAPLLPAQQVTIPASTPLRIALEDQLRLRHPGDPVYARLAAPIYIGERVVLPAGTRITGHIQRLTAVSRMERAGTIAHGDFTPLRIPDIRLDRITLADGTALDIKTQEASLAGEPLRMSPAHAHQSRLQEIKSTVRERKDEALKTIKTESKFERIKERAILSLPYHPQWIDAGTRFDADLAAPVSVTLPPEPAAERSPTTLPLNATVHARFVSTISSAENSPGDPVVAEVTEPLFDSDHRLILPQGTLLRGEIQRAESARWFGRGGKLRFRFSSVELPPAYAATASAATPQHISGQLTAAEGNPQNRLRLDPEGGTESVPAANRFLAPLTLGVLATSSTDREHGSSSGAQGALAGGFGITGRLVSIGMHALPASPVLSYYALSQSLYSHWIARGKNVTYPKNTRIEVSFGER